MSDDLTDNEDDAWEDVALRRIFLECLASSSSSSSLSSLPSTTSKVYVSTLVDYIRDNASDNFRDEALLDELQAAIEEVSSDSQVNWTLFKKASRRWVDKVRRNRWQDGNNNIEKNDSNDDLLERSDDERTTSGVIRGNTRDFGNLAERNRKLKTPRRFVTADFVNLSNVSSYSPSSDTTHGCAMSTDTTPESADDTDAGSGSCGEVAQVDLRLRVRRFDEENALLREELVRAEELSAGFQRQFENLRRKLDQTNDKCRQLERENDEHKEILHEVEQKERDCRWALQKAEKERALLDRKLEEAEAERQQITILASKLELCKKEKLDSVREAIVCRQEVEEKQAECELLREKLAQIANRNDSLQESYEKTIRHLRQQNQELKNEIFEIQSKQSVESMTEEVSLVTPTRNLLSFPQSTPYSNNKNVHQDSLYTELKASGFSVEDSANESRLRELEEELSWYNEEIRDAVKQIDKVLEEINRQRPAVYVPDLQLDGSIVVKTADIYELLQKISKLSNAVNEMIWKPKVKDASSQLCVDSTAHAEQRICSQYGITSFQDGLRLASENRGRETVGGEANERPESGFFVEAFSMNSRLVGEYVEEVEVASETEKSQRETGAISPSKKGSMTAPLGIQEHTIIDPIVEELDRILQCTNQNQEETLAPPSNCSPSKNPKFRCIYTCAQSASGQRVTEVNCSVADSTANSPKRLERDLAATYVISSGGDAPPLGMVNNSLLTNEDNTVDRGDSMLKIISSDDSTKLGVDSQSELMLKTQDLESTEVNESETLPEESIDRKLGDLKSSSENLSSLSISSTPSEPSTPRKIDEPSVAEKEDLPSAANGVTYCVTPNKSLGKLAKRKLSVFHRSFDIDTLQAIGTSGGPDTYRLTERSLSTPDAKKDKQRHDDMELDLDCMKKTPSTRNFLLNTYRTNAHDTDSSESPSPEKSLGYRRGMDRVSCSIVPVLAPSIGQVPTRLSTRPIVSAPKLKLPLLNDVARFPRAENKPAESRSDDVKNVKKSEEILPETKDDDEKAEADLTANETRETEDVSNVDVSQADSSVTSEMIRPGDEIERGITYRRGSFSRESDFSGYSLLSISENSTADNNLRDAKIESASTVVPSSDGESTSCDSSPKRIPTITPAPLPLLSTYDKPKNGERPYARPDPSKSWSLRQAGRSSEISGGGVIGGYQTRSDSISKNSSGSIGSYRGGGGGGIRATADEKASVVPAVALAMSSGEDSSDSECVPMAIQRKNEEDRHNAVDETRSISPSVLPFVNGAFLGSSTPAPEPAGKSNSAEEQSDSGPRKPVAQKRDKRERLHTIRRSLSESGCGRSESSSCHCTTGSSIPAEFNKEITRPNAFPSLTDARLQESGIANLSSSDELGGSLPEADLERKYTALSVGLVTDRVTLPRRMALSIRQRDQSERNLASEVLKMHQDIQDLAPLCIDRESLERVERVRHQLEMITQCAHRVSCTAETLGAVHQEHRIARAVLLADRYLLVLRSRCEKLASDLAETKRILMENNIVVEENNGELGDDLPRIRYKGMPTNNRTMMARRRASIATIFRPLGNFQDLTKDGVRQRNSVSGRVTLRRPSLSAESQKWEADKLDRTDSSSSIGELREIFEQAESRRNSREENNNVLRLHSSNLSIRDCDNGEVDLWANTREEPIVEVAAVEGCQESRVGRRTPQFWTTHTNVPWKPMLWCILISFFFGFYMKHVVSSVSSSCSGTPLRWWSIEELLERYVSVNNNNNGPTPI